MLVYCSAPMLALGLFLLISGRMRLSGKREIRGGYARLAGFILMLPLGLDLLMVQLGVVGVGRYGAAEARVWLLMDILFVIAAIIAVLGIVVLMPHTVREQRDQLPAPVVLSNRVTVADAARYLRISEREVMYFIGKGEIRCSTPPYLDRDSLIAFVKH
ncbi:MAG: hypothetical protein IT324_17305 [Anaerolineae bacterium]|nr:hypothetical protein [Anaerolineae bacterium]